MDNFHIFNAESDQRKEETEISILSKYGPVWPGITKFVPSS